MLRKLNLKKPVSFYKMHTGFLIIFAYLLEKEISTQSYHSVRNLTR